MARIYGGYTNDTRVDANDYFIKDHNTAGTKTVKASDLAVEMAGMMSAVNHRNVYRGKDLGTEITAAQKAAISAGTFDDLFIGDYWTINGTRYDIADMDYFYNVSTTGGSASFTTHHLVMIPHNNMYDAKMNDTNSTTDGYTGSKMYTENLDAAKTTISTDFDDMVITHRDYLVNAVTNGVASGAAWFDSTVELMNEIMVYSTMIMTNRGDGSSEPSLKTTASKQLALFRLLRWPAQRKVKFWLRDVVSDTKFAVASTYGYTGADTASSAHGVRPYFLIG